MTKKRTNKCQTCLGEVSSRKTLLCRKCYYEKRKALPWKWHCLDCGNDITSKVNKRCPSCHGKYVWRLFREGKIIIPSRKGFKMPLESVVRGTEKRKLKGIMPPHFKGAAHYNWKGGISSEANKIRVSEANTTWRRDIMKRDKYRCQECYQWGHQLQVHHIYPFRDFIKYRFERWNGITLCVNCHRKTKKKEIQASTLFLSKLGIYI